jgi:hypothetical protein
MRATGMRGLFDREISESPRISSVLFSFSVPPWLTFFRFFVNAFDGPRKARKGTKLDTG